MSQAWSVGGVGDTEGCRRPQRYPTRHICRGNRSDTDEACDKKRIWQQDKKNRWKKQSNNANKPTKHHTNSLIMCREKETKDAFFFLETAWIVYLFSVKVTGNPKLPTPLSSLHPCYTYRCPLPSLIILSLHSFTT